jgi:hypothetical protein
VSFDPVGEIIQPIVTGPSRISFCRAESRDES